MGVIADVIPLKYEVDWELQRGSSGGCSMPKPDAFLKANDVTFVQRY
jgi:hypothetical protein